MLPGDIVEMAACLFHFCPRGSVQYPTLRDVTFITYAGIAIHKLAL